jgi:hypothetical protein
MASRQNNNNRNMLNQTSNKDTQDIPIFSQSKSSSINHKQATGSARIPIHRVIPRSTPMSTKIAGTDTANFATRLSTAQSCPPPASAGRSRVASAIAAAVAFEDAPTVPAPVRSASRCAQPASLTPPSKAISAPPTPALPPPTPQSLPILSDQGRARAILNCTQGGRAAHSPNPATMRLPPSPQPTPLPHAPSRGGGDGEQTSAQRRGRRRRQGVCWRCRKVSPLSSPSSPRSPPSFHSH